MSVTWQQGWETIERLAGHPDRFIPGHDPIVSEIYPRPSDKVDAFALHSGTVAIIREIASPIGRGASATRGRNVKEERYD
jgi:hypothetical protein